MRKMMTAFAAISLAMGTVACKDMAGSDTEEVSITGAWKANVDSAQFENDTRNYVLANGKFDCKSCQPPFQVKADGTWQSVDRPGSDSQMIEVVDDNTVRAAARLGDKNLGSSTWTVSEDGDTLTIAFNDVSGDEPVTGSTIFTRTATGPDGSHAVSGEWIVSDIAEISDTGLLFDYALDGDQYASSGNGTSFTATLGGEPVAIEGDDAGTMVAVEQTGENSYRETYTRDGEVVSILDMTIEGDTLSATSNDPRDGSSVAWTATRQ